MVQFSVASSASNKKMHQPQNPSDESTPWNSKHHCGRCCFNQPFLSETFSSSKSFTGTVHVNSKQFVHQQVTKSPQPQSLSRSPLVLSKVSLTSPMPGAPLPTTPPVPAPVREAPRPEPREHRPSGSLVVKKKDGGRIGEGTYLHYFYRKKKGDILQFTHVFFNLFP